MEIAMPGKKVFISVYADDILLRYSSNTMLSS